MDQWALLDSAMSRGMSAIQQKEWAGASHWRFRRTRQQQQQQQQQEVRGCFVRLQAHGGANRKLEGL